MQIITTTNKIKTYNSTMHLKFVNFKTVLHLNKIYRVSHNTLHMSHTSHFHTCNTIFYLLNEKYQVCGILSVLLKKSSTWGRSSLSPHPDASRDIPVYLDRCDESINLTIEIEKINEISFLDILVKRSLNNSFMTPVLWPLHQMRPDQNTKG